MYCGTSRKLRSEAKEAIMPISSNCSSSLYAVSSSVSRDLLDVFAFEGKEVTRLRPSAEMALLRRLVVMQDDRAGVVCMILLSCNLFAQ